MHKAGQSSSEFFLSGRSISWWLLIFLGSDNFSADTPNLVTDIRKTAWRATGSGGLLPTGLTTVFIYAKLWRRTGVTTDIEFMKCVIAGNPARLFADSEPFILA